MAIGLGTTQNFSVKILWGSTSTREENKPCLYEFDTRDELDAFMEGVEEAVGWMDFEIVKE